MSGSTVRAFVDRALAKASDEVPAVAVFNAVRDLPYATDGAWDAAGLMAQGFGNCVAKSELLCQSLGVLGCDTRLVRWTYALTDPFADLLSVDFDVHTAAQVRIGRGWVTVDAAHDRALPAPPFVVNHWDGGSDTPRAYAPTSAMWVPGEDDEEIDAAIDGIASALAGIDTSEYAGRFNAWVRELRSSASAT